MQATLKETANVTALSQLRSQAAGNLWANQRLINWLRTKPQELLESEVPSSFASIRLTLLHIWDVERFWLATMNGTPHQRSFKEAGFAGSMEDIYNGLLAGSEELLAYTQSLSEDELSAKRHFVIPNIVDAYPRICDIVPQIANHSYYHRGQVVTIGRNLGFTDAPMTDYMFYCLMVNNENTGA